MKKNLLKPILFESIIDILVIILGLSLCYFVDKENVLNKISIVTFAIVKIVVTLSNLKKKNRVEKIFNISLMIFLGIFEISIFHVMLIKIKDIKDFTDCLRVFFCLISMLVLILAESYFKEKSNSKAIIPITTLIFFITTFSIVLYFVDTTQSAMISAVTAVTSLLLTPETLEDVFNVKVNETGKRQLSQLKLSLVVLIPIIYISSVIFPSHENTGKSFGTILTVGLYRFIVLEFTFPIFVFLIYIKKIRQNVQVFLGLSPDLKYLYGNWSMLSVNQFTTNEIIVRNFLLNIDGNRVKYLGETLTFDENYNIYNEKEEKVGVIERVNDERININLDGTETKLKLVKMGSSQYREFHQFSKEDEKFYNTNVLEPITNTQLEVTIFTSQKNQPFLVEANSKTNYRYQFKNGSFVQIDNIKEADFKNFSSQDLFESSTFK